MEAILVYNQCVPFVHIDRFCYFSPKDGDGTSVDAFARQTHFLDIPVTVKLLEFFKSCGIKAEPKVKPGDTVQGGPMITLGFENFCTVSSYHKGYLDVRCFTISNEIFHDPGVLDSFDVKLRLDIETLTEENSSCTLKPGVLSNVFDMYRDEDDDFLTPEDQLCLNFEDDNESKLIQNWTLPASKWKMTMSLSLIVAPLREADLPDEGVTDHLIPYKRMRTDDTFADFTIIAGSGAEIKCHRNVLAAQSAYFAQMLQSGMTESTTGTVELPGMTEEGVRAMLDYLYAWKTTVPGKNSLVCVELLEAGDKWEMKPMEDCMKKILLSKPAEWYTPEAALRLILYLKDMNMADLKATAVKMYKANFAEILKLPAYAELCKEKPEVMKQLLEYLSTD